MATKIVAAIVAALAITTGSAFAQDAYDADRTSCINLTQTEAVMKNAIASLRNDPSLDPGKFAYEMYAVADEKYGPSFSDYLRKMGPIDFETPAGRHKTAEDVAIMTLGFERMHCAAFMKYSEKH